MAIPIVQIGQCGNQVGGSIYETIVNDLTSLSDVEGRSFGDYDNSSKDRFFIETSKGKWKCRAVMVDMEEKAVSAVQDRHRYLSFPGQFRLTGKRGSGNNWAAGYQNHGPKMEKQAVEMVRKLIEPCDRVDGIMASMSLAGGTGSGLGTRLCEAIHEAFPDTFLMALPVWPFRRGEVSVQAYNAVLSLSHLQKSVDALMLFENDLLHDICQRRLGTVNVSMDQLNQLIGHQVVSLLQPVRSVTCPLSDLMTHTVPHPDYKLLQLRTIPYMADRCLEFSTDQWPQLMKHLHQMLIADAFVDEGIDWSVKVNSKRSTLLAAVLALRGREVDDAQVKMFSENHLYPSWRKMDDDCCLVWRESRPFRQYARSACMLTNGQNCLPSLNSCLSQAWRMFSSKAFIHQYSAHGFSEADFLDSFAVMEQVVYNYQFVSKETS